MKGSSLKRENTENNLMKWVTALKGGQDEEVLQHEFHRAQDDLKESDSTKYLVFCRLAFISWDLCYLWLSP